MRRYVDGHWWIVDNDLSFSYGRALSTTFEDVADRGNYSLFEIEPEWDAHVEVMAEILAKGDMTRDFLVYDSTTPTWQWVQNHASDKVHGLDVADFMLKARAEHPDSIKEYNKTLTEGMSWPLINKMYQRDFYNPLRKWRGHFILTAEAAEVRTGNHGDDKDVIQLYGPYGVKPKGQGGIHHVAATNLLFTKGRTGDYKWTTIKDRERDEYENAPLEDFAEDYVENVAGWVPEMRSE